MNPYKNRTFDELLRMRLNEEVFDRILEILDQKQRMGLGGHRETIHFISDKTIWRPRRNAVTMPIKMDAN